MPKQYCLIFLLIYFCITTTTLSQDSRFEFKKINATNGLSHNSGLCIVKDSVGFIWIGTQDGLSRYDGLNFYNFNHVPGDSTSLSDSYINSLYVDKDGTLWIGTNQGGLNRYNRYKNSFTAFQNDPENKNSIGEGSIYSINEDKYGNLWVGVNPGGLYLFDKEYENFYHFKNNADDHLSISGKRVHTIFRDNEDDLWIGTDDGLNKLMYVEDSLAIEKFKIDNSKFIRDHKTFDNKLIYFLRWTNDKLNPNSLVNNEVTCVAQNQSDMFKEYWIGTWDGISRMLIDDKNIIFDNITDLSNLNLDQPKLRIWSILVNANSIWIGTSGNGLLHYSIADKLYTQLRNDTQKYNGIKGSTVRSIFNDNTGLLYFGTETDGVYIKEQNPKPFHLIKHSKQDPGSISDNNVISVYEDSKGNLWVGTRLGGLNKLTKSGNNYTVKKIYKYVPGNPKSLLSNTIKSVFEDAEGTIWFGNWSSSGGLSNLDPVTENLFHYQHNSKDQNSLSDNQVRAIAEDKNGNLWIGLSETGLDRYDKSRNEFTHFSNDPTDTQSLSDNTVMYIYKDRNE